MEDNKYSILGYLFGFMGSITFVEVFVAFGLGFVGAFGGWIFEKIKVKYLDKKTDKNG